MDEVAVDDCTSESDFESDLDHKVVDCLTSTPISWEAPLPEEDEQGASQTLDKAFLSSPSSELQNINCNVQQNLERALSQVHDQKPHLLPVQNRVYDMAPILDSIRARELHSSGATNYTLGDKKRLDYKKLHKGQ